MITAHSVPQTEENGPRNSTRKENIHAAFNLLTIFCNSALVTGILGHQTKDEILGLFEMFSWSFSQKGKRASDWRKMRFQKMRVYEDNAAE